MSTLPKYQDALWAKSVGIDEYGDQFVKLFRRDIDSPDPKYPFYAGFTIPFQFGEADGLPSAKDQEALAILEDALVKILEGADEGRLVYSISSNHHKTFLFYTRTNIESFMEAIQQALKDGPVVIEIDQDPSWGLLMDHKALYDEQEKQVDGV